MAEGMEFGFRFVNREFMDNYCDYLVCNVNGSLMAKSVKLMKEMPRLLPQLAYLSLPCGPTPYLYSESVKWMLITVDRIFSLVPEIPWDPSMVQVIEQSEASSVNGDESSDDTYRGLRALFVSDRVHSSGSVQSQSVGFSGTEIQFSELVGPSALTQGVIRLQLADSGIGVREYLQISSGSRPKPEASKVPGLVSSQVPATSSMSPGLVSSQAPTSSPNVPGLVSSQVHMLPSSKVPGLVSSQVPATSSMGRTSSSNVPGLVSSQVHVLPPSSKVPGLVSSQVPATSSTGPTPSLNVPGLVSSQVHVPSSLNAPGLVSSQVHLSSSMVPGQVSCQVPTPTPMSTGQKFCHAPFRPQPEFVGSAAPLPEFVDKDASFQPASLAEFVANVSLVNGKSDRGKHDGYFMSQQQRLCGNCQSSEVSPIACQSSGTAEISVLDVVNRLCERMAERTELSERRAQEQMLRMGTFDWFDGSNENEFSVWFSALNNRVEKANVDDSVKLEHLMYCLRGRARRDFLEMVNEPSWEEAVRVLVSRYGSEQRCTERVIAFQSCRQRQNESVKEFAARLKASCPFGPDCPEIYRRGVLIGRLLDGLSNVGYKKIAAKADQNPTLDFDRVVSEIVKEEEIDIMYPNGRQVQPKFDRHAGVYDASQRASYAHQASFRAQGPGKCYSCGQGGHIAARCPWTVDNFGARHDSYNGSPAVFSAPPVNSSYQTGPIMANQQSPEDDTRQDSVTPVSYGVNSGHVHSSKQDHLQYVKAIMHGGPNVSRPEESVMPGLNEVLSELRDQVAEMKAMSVKTQSKEVPASTARGNMISSVRLPVKSVLAAVKPTVSSEIAAVINGANVPSERFTADTGAMANLIDESFLKRLPKCPEVKPCNAPLMDVNQRGIGCEGICEVSVTLGSENHRVSFHIKRNLGEDVLLGLPGCELWRLRLVNESGLDLTSYVQAVKQSNSSSLQPTVCRRRRCASPERESPAVKKCRGQPSMSPVRMRKPKHRDRSWVNGNGLRQPYRDKAAVSRSCGKCSVQGHRFHECPNLSVDELQDVVSKKCGCKGHFASSCSVQVETRKCHACRSVGHLSVNCPKAQDSEPFPVP